MKKSICVFCGSSPGASAVYREAARDIGTELVKNDLDLVYGGGNVGLMGLVADAVIAAGGKVTGVIPEFLANKEVAHDGLSELHLVTSMHERKALMSELSHGFISLPGGLGTFEEMFEVLTWQQLEVQSKPCALFNVASYYDPLLAMLDRAVEEEFMKPVHRDMLIVGTNAEDLISRLLDYQHVHTDKWLNRK